MQKSTPTDPQEHNDPDLVGQFKNLGQRFQNALADKTEDTMKTVRFIQREIDRLRVEKSKPDAPKQFILEAIAANEARHPPLDAKLKRAERIKEKLIEDTNTIFEKAIRSLAKSEEEESKEHMLPNQRVIQLETDVRAYKQEIDALKQVIASLKSSGNALYKPKDAEGQKK